MDGQEQNDTSFFFNCHGGVSLLLGEAYCTTMSSAAVSSTMSYPTYLLLLVLLVGCATYSDRELPTFTWNSVRSNSLIVDRYPEYGITERDGCVVQPEIHLDLRTSENGEIEGTVIEVSSREAVRRAVVVVLTEKGKDLRMVTDRTGKFQGTTSGAFIELTVQSIGYRTLTIRF